MPTTTATSFRTAITALADWLTRHPNIPIDYLEYADDLEAELTSGIPGGFQALTTIADAADALADSTIEVTDLDDVAGVTRLTVSGTTDGLTVTVKTIVQYGARVAFLQSLAARPLDEAVIWTTTAAHLRAVAATGGA